MINSAAPAREPHWRYLPEIAEVILSTMPTTPIYKVIFVNQNKVYELYCKAIYQSEMYGFIEIEDYVFGDQNQVIVDPGEEKLKNEFHGVVRSYIPMHAIVRIDEVEKEGTGKISEGVAGTNVTAFPLPAGAKPVKQDGE